MSQEEILPAIIGFDLAKPRSDETVMRVHGGRRVGKSEAMRKYIERALDDGLTVYDATTGEVRGAGAAKDVTPRAPKLIKGPTSKEGMQ